AAKDLLRLDDDSLIVAYWGAAPLTTRIRRYAADGSVLLELDRADWRANRLAWALDDQVSFWVWYFDADQYAIFERIRVSDGTVLATFRVPTFTSGVFQPDPEDDPPRFGISNSCPLLVTTEALTPQVAPDPDPYTPPSQDVTLPIVRERITPILSVENKRITIPYIELDIQPGVGTSTGSDTDP